MLYLCNLFLKSCQTVRGRCGVTWESRVQNSSLPQSVNEERERHSSEGAWGQDSTSLCIKNISAAASLKLGDSYLTRKIFPLRSTTSNTREPTSKQQHNKEGSGNRIIYVQHKEDKQQTENKCLSEFTVRTFTCQTLLYPASVIVQAYWSLSWFRDSLHDEGAVKTHPPVTSFTTHRSSVFAPSSWGELQNDHERDLITWNRY